MTCICLEYEIIITSAEKSQTNATSHLPIQGSIPISVSQSILMLFISHSQSMEGLHIVHLGKDLSKLFYYTHPQWLYILLESNK